MPIINKTILTILNTGIGMGVSYQPNQRFNTFNSIYLPFSGNNNFDENLNFSKAFIYTSGFNFALDSKTAFEGYITNSFGQKFNDITWNFTVLPGEIKSESLFNEDIPASITFPDFVSANIKPHFLFPGSIDINLLI